MRDVTIIEKEMQKRELVVGQKIRGYGILNEYGEFDFIPEQTGVREGQQKLVKTSEDFTLSETKNLIIVHMRLKRAQREELLRKFLSVSSELINLLNRYDF